MTHLGEKVQPDALLTGEYDSVVMATGVVPRSLTGKVKGMDQKNVLSYIDVLTGKVEVGSKVAVIGAGGIGFDVAEYLAHNPKNDGKYSKRRCEQM